MSEKKDPTREGAPTQGAGLFTKSAGAVRDAIPTADEGDALLDMLFDDAVRLSPEPAVPAAPAAAPEHPRRTPTPPTPIPGEVVAPPGWAVGAPPPGPPPAPRPAPVRPGSMSEDLPTRVYSAPPPDFDDEALDIGRDAPDLSGLSFDDPSTTEFHPSPDRPAPRPPEYSEPAEEVDLGEATIIAPPVHADPRREPDELAFGEIAPELAALDSFDDDDDAAPTGVVSQPPPLRAPAPRVAPPPAVGAAHDAAAVLAQTEGARESFLQRAAWLAEEAALRQDKVPRARMMMVVSELYAIAGDDESAAAAASEAHQLAPNVPMVIRQHRAMIARQAARSGPRAWAAVADVLETETRHMPTAEGRAHAAWMAAEIARVSIGDPEAARKRAEQAMRALPSDPRPSVQRFAETLAQGYANPGAAAPAVLAKIKPSDPEALASLGAAFGQVVAMRAPAPVARGAERHPYESILAARAALSEADRPAVLAALAELRTSSFAPASGWLVAAVAGARPDSRGEAIGALRVAAQGTAPAAARRALAGLSVEAGESVDVRDHEAFGPADRVALAALDAARPGPSGLAAREALAPILDEAAADSGASEQAADVALLAGAAVAAVLPKGDQRLARLRYATAGTPASTSAAHLGRVLASVDPSSDEAERRAAIDAAVGELAQHIDPAQPARTALVRALALELDIEAKAADRVAQAIATWGEGEHGADTTGLLAAALLAEVSGDVERARQVYAEVHREEPVHEVTARASQGVGDPSVLVKMLKDHAETLPMGLPRAVLLTECAIRYASLALGQAEESNEADAFATQADACAKAAAELAPQLPIAVHLGEIAARARADQDALLEWLRERRESTEDPVERAHDLAREALLVSDGESNVAAALLEQALRARPADVALRELYERLSPEPPSDRATWREERALAIRSESPEEASRLALEAALEFERAGDIEAAARCAKLAEACGERDLSPIAINRFALSGFGTAELVDRLLPQARETQDAAERLEIYERLAELDERGRGDTASGLLFRRTILEENPAHLRTLRRVASVLMAEGREDELEPIAMELARHLEGGEAAAYAALATRLRLRARWEDTAEPVRIAYAQEPRQLWAIRQMAAHARAAGEHRLAAQCDQELMARTDRPLERAVLALRAAESLRASGAEAEARSLLEDAVELVPSHLRARLTLASVLEAEGHAAVAAAHLEAAAETMVQPAWKAETDYRAGVLWMDAVGDVVRARAALERVWALLPGYADSFERLRQIYVGAGARSELAALLEGRLDTIKDPAERVEMEVMRGRALAEVGDSDAAKRALAAALDQNPDHVDALAAFAELCMSEGDHEGAEQALIRLARLTSDPDKQVAIYFRLGHLYDDLLPNTERAELAYQEILKRRPNDYAAREKMIALYRRTAQLSRAVDEQNVLVNAAEAVDDKCKRTVELAEILEEMGELKKAESTLVVARKSFPKSDVALRALVRFYQRTGQAPAAAVLLDRAVADARRALGTGRFEAFLFETLSTAAELRGRHDAATVARATVRALEGVPSDLPGGGHRAGDAKLDELLAPEVMTPSFRELLLRTGPMFDTAFPYDFDAVRAAPLPPSMGALGEELRALAGAYGLPQIQILVSGVLGPVCIPARSHPPTIVVGQILAEQDASPERSFLFHRAMKVLQANAAILARTAPIDLWPVLAAYLKVFSPSFAPQGVDAGRFTEAYGRLSRALPPGLAQDVGVLAADVIGTIGNRASTLNAAINGWGSRAGLVAVADPNVALVGIAWAGGNANGPPPAGKDRLTWIGRNAEARDLVIFSVSDAYVEARARLGG